MSPFLQTVLVLTIVAGCAIVLGFQAFRTFSSGKGKLGSCCSKGCGAGEASKSAVVPKQVQVIPSDQLFRRQ